MVVVVVVKLVPLPSKALIAEAQMSARSALRNIDRGSPSTMEAGGDYAGGVMEAGDYAGAVGAAAVLGLTRHDFTPVRMPMWAVVCFGML